MSMLLPRLRHHLSVSIGGHDKISDELGGKAQPNDRVLNPSPASIQSFLSPLATSNPLAPNARCCGSKIKLLSKLVVEISGYRRGRIAFTSFRFLSYVELNSVTESFGRGTIMVLLSVAPRTRNPLSSLHPAPLFHYSQCLQAQDQDSHFLVHPCPREVLGVLGEEDRLLPGAQGKKQRA